MKIYAFVVVIFTSIFISEIVTGYEFWVGLSDSEEMLLNQLFEVAPNEFNLNPLLLENIDKLKGVNTELIADFDKHIKARDGIGLNDHKQKVKELWDNMYETEKKINDFVGKNCMTSQDRLIDHQIWFEEFTGTFGDDYIKLNSSTIVSIIQYLLLKSSLECGIEIRKEYLIRELLYQEYSFLIINDFTNFLNNLKVDNPTNDYDIVKIKGILQNYLGIIRKRSFLHIYFDFPRVYEKKIKIPFYAENLLQYLSAVPALQKPFNPLSVSKLLHSIK